MEIQKIRDFFPQLKNVTYLNTGTSGPMALPVIEEIKRYLNIAELEGHASPLLWNERGKLNLRQKTAQFLNAVEEEICFTSSTSQGLGIVFAGIDWQEGDEIIVAHPEYISGMLDCMLVEKNYGVKVRVIDGDDRGFIIEDKFIEAINEKTKLILISHVAYHNGQRIKVSEISNIARDKGILVLIDGAQSAGAIDINIKNIDPDFYALPAQKWLLSEEGLGVLYIKKESLNRIKPTYLGYLSVDYEGFSPDKDFNLHNDARRFEITMSSHAAYFAFSKSLDFYNMIGEKLIFSRIEKLTDYLKKELLKIKELKLITPLKYENSSGLVSFIIKEGEHEKIAKKLYDKEKIIIRSIPLPDCLRVSLHYFNTEEEVDILIKALKNQIIS